MNNPNSSVDEAIVVFFRHARKAWNEGNLDSAIFFAELIQQFN